MVILGMANLYKQVRSPFWWASFYIKDAHGKTKRVRFSTGLKDRKKAELKMFETIQAYYVAEGGGAENSAAVLEQLQKATALAAKGELNTHIGQEILNNMLEATSEVEVRSYTLKEWFEVFLVNQKPILKADTYRVYKATLTNLEGFLGDKVNMKLRSFTRQDAVAWRLWFLERGRVAKTANHNVTILHGAFKMAVQDGILSKNVLTGIEKLPTDDSKSRAPFKRVELEKLIENAPTEDWRGAIIAAATTGLRMMDVTNLRWSQVDLGRRVISIIPRKTSRSKKMLQLPIHDRLNDFIMTLPAGDDALAPLFGSLCDRRAGGRDGLSKEFGELMDALGISRTVQVIDAVGDKSVSLKSFHSLRHTFVSSMANADVSQELRRKLAGHSSDAVNDIYTHTQLDTLRGAVDAIDL